MKPIHISYIMVLFILLVVLFGCGKPEQAPSVNLPDVGGLLAPERSSDKMWLTVPAMERVNNLPVHSGGRDEWAEHLKTSALHVESTGFPWEDNRNVYIAGHRLGYKGEKSWLVFEDIDELKNGDKVILRDDAGRKYEYEIFEKRIVSPNQLSVLEPKSGLDTITLQSCTKPAYADRILVVGKRTN